MILASGGRLLAALWLCEVTAAYGISMIYAATRALVTQFGDPIMIGWLATAPLLVGAASAAVAARLGDLYGRRRILLAMMFVSGCGLAVGTFSASFPVILIARGLQGLTMAVLPLGFGIVRQRIAPDRMPQAIGVIVSAASAGTVLALVAGGMLTDRFGWHGVFAAGAVLSFLSVAATLALIPPDETRRDGRSIDYGSALLAVPAIAGLLLVISNARSWGWADPRLPGILLVSLGLGAMWVVRSLRLADPLIDFRLFGKRDVLVVNLTYMLIALGSFQINLIVSMLLQAPKWTGIGLGVPATTAGLATMPSILFAMLIAPLTGIWIARFGGRTVTIAGGIVTIGGWLCAMAWHSSVASIAIGMCAMAAGGVILYASGPAILIGAVPAERTSEATGMMIVLRTMAMAAGAQIVSVLLATDVVLDPSGGKARFPSDHAFLLAMGAVTLASLAATLTAMALRRHPPGPAATA